MAIEDSRLLIDKSFDTIMTETITEMNKKGIRTEGAGNIAKLILSIVNSHIAGFYDSLKLQHAQAFLSQATGSNVDKIGEMLNCLREEGESDSQYKYRITKSTLSQKAANETAIRIAILSLQEEGQPVIKDVILKPFTHGPGSFSVYPIIDNPSGYTPEFLEYVSKTVQEVKGYGIKASVLSPRLSEVEITGHILYSDAIAPVDQNVAVYNITYNIRKYINERKPGDVLSINDMKRIAIQQSSSVADIEINELKVNGKNMFPVDQKSNWNERFIEAKKVDAIRFS